MSNTTKTAKTYTECSRCQGYGEWAPGRVCYKCGGFGQILNHTKAMVIEAKKAHIAEVKESIARNEAAILTARFGKAMLTKRLEAAKANLARLLPELAALEAPV